MIVKVCDAICGAGKTQSCITMINDSGNKKFMFVTPYLDEVERIKRSCAGKDFVSPEQTGANHFSKLNDIVRLIRDGKNIATTHALFSNYTDSVKELIQKQKYTLILDEEINLFQPVAIDGGDVDFLVRNNIAKVENEKVSWVDKHYKGVVFNDIVRLAQSRNMVDYDGSFYFWTLPMDVFNCFTDVYILTYMFEYQPIGHYFIANQIKYELIGTTKKNGTYRFCPMPEMDRRIDLRDKIHICDNPRFNRVGDAAFSLSAGWYDRAAEDPDNEELQELKADIRKFLRKTKNGNTDKMWTCLNRHRSLLSGKGYSAGFLTYNKRATNDFANKHYLAFCLNVYMMPWIQNYLSRIGATKVSQGMYALSVLIQWLFRSAIRKGEEVWLYLPSKRMRLLLKGWLNNLAEGNDLREVTHQREITKIQKKSRTMQGMQETLHQMCLQHKKDKRRKNNEKV